MYWDKVLEIYVATLNKRQWYLLSLSWKWQFQENRLLGCDAMLLQRYECFGRVLLLFPGEKLEAAGFSKHWSLSTRLHGIRSQKLTIMFISTGLRTLNITLKVLSFISAYVNYRIWHDHWWSIICNASGHHNGYSIICRFLLSTTCPSSWNWCWF